MYTTGELAKICHVSQRMLRHYDKIGLLKPTIIGENGYRYYDENAVITLGRITQLKRYQLSLAAIGEILERKDSQYTNRVLAEQIQQLRSNSYQQESLITEMQRQVRSIQQQDFFGSESQIYDVMMGKCADRRCICLRKVTNEADITTMIDTLFQSIQADGSLTAEGPQMALFHESFEYDLEAMDVEVCIPVGGAQDDLEDVGEQDEFPMDESYIRIIPGGLRISTIHLGIYDLIGGAYHTLMQWASENEYEITGGAIEKYLKDYRDTQDGTAFITEISLPVCKK